MEKAGGDTARNRKASLSPHLTVLLFLVSAEGENKGGREGEGEREEIKLFFVKVFVFVRFSEMSFVCVCKI